jgi:hypothetical protein
MSTSQESGIKWWLRYVLVPLVGGGGVVALIVAAVLRPDPAQPPPGNTVVTPVAPVAPEVSRDFFVGRWQVDQSYGEVSGGAVIDYQADGSLSGSMTQFVGGVGQRVQIGGEWDFQKLSADTFRLDVQLYGQPRWAGTFKVLDRDHVQNLDQNYVSTRVR